MSLIIDRASAIPSSAMLSDKVVLGAALIAVILPDSATPNTAFTLAVRASLLMALSLAAVRARLLTTVLNTFVLRELLALYKISLISRALSMLPCGFSDIKSLAILLAISSASIVALAISLPLNE